MALLPAVVVSQPPGFGGVPSTGHFSRATRSASLAASSATSMSPKRRTSEATTRPYSSRKIRSIADGGDRLGLRRLERPDLDLAPRRPWSPPSAHLSAASRSGASMTQKPPRYSLDSAYGPSVTIGLSPVLSTVVAVRRRAAGRRRTPRRPRPGAFSLNRRPSRGHLLRAPPGPRPGRRSSCCAVHGQQVLGHVFSWLWAALVAASHPLHEQAARIRHFDRKEFWRIRLRPRWGARPS